ncbi:argininosuccinate lyase [Fructilactobacillus florum]|uniref:Argininosuccinate lyase n=1 Tax=Fructilactobacillus florum DSM 22689 = JCM 16035 TaxID=1423745 RepID=A0A0R2CND5_9LACO|nr:argininosuccinate lyase [Fructilactobacillus florum]KRM89820.1 argininosuccinate lyase [Fructilactobacillus florum DSM 22689 = JCM 16035]
MSSNKLWGGRFQKQADELVDQFGASIAFDQELADEDLAGSLAHVKMLEKTKILSSPDVAKIVAGLEAIRSDLHAGKLKFTTTNEDIHMNIEQILTERIGPVAGKLHTARSRNDQVATDFHLYLKRRLPKIIAEIRTVQETLVELAERHVTTIMPGYTHLQHAQPISYAHYLLAYYQMFKRDCERFEFNQQHVDLLPLGAAALAGTTFPIDRQFTARELGFSKVYENSLDAVSDRDFAVEFLSNSSLLLMHLSRFCEELSMWVSFEFNFLELSDAYTTGSSIMPQKKNPDMAELIRGKSGRVYGHLLALLSTLKSLPLAYNKDLQEDKEGVFDTVKTILPALRVFNGMIKTLTVKTDQMEQSTTNDLSNATELADYLAAKGVPFRKAHGIVGRLVLHCLQTKQNLQDLSLAELQAAAPEIEADVYHDLQPEVAVARRNSEGGTGFDQVRKQLARAKAELQTFQK